VQTVQTVRAKKNPAGDLMISQLFTAAAGDKAAISLSLTCALHCLMVPLLVTLFPTTMLLGLQNERIHLFLLALIVPISVFSLTLGCRQHRNLSVVASGVAGVGILFFSALLSHEIGGHTLETVGTVVGSGIVAISHILNFRLCRSSETCKTHHDGHLQSPSYLD